MQKTGWQDHSPCWCFHQQDSHTENNITCTALVGVFTNKIPVYKTKSRAQPLLVLSPTRITYRKQYHNHSPCWCFHQQDSHKVNNITSTALVGVFTNKIPVYKTKSRAQPLLVLSPTRFTYRKQYNSTALVGVFTNKIPIQKTISRAQPLLVFSPTRLTYRKQYHVHSPCWCFHQQESHTENNITCTALVGVFTNKSRIKPKNNKTTTALVGVFTNKIPIQKTISRAQPLLVLSPTRHR
jgi:hypothetical protein